jgi:cytochrome c oxidase assembly protein subunit 11
MTVRIGATSMATFTASNPADHAISGSATFNVTPEIAGRFFNKIQCFCFNQQTLQAHETVTMPVVFYIDPTMVDEVGARDIHDITLSYTFFAVPDGLVPTAAAKSNTRIF